MLTTCFDKLVSEIEEAYFPVKEAYFPLKEAYFPHISSLKTSFLFALLTKKNCYKIIYADNMFL